MNALYVLQTCTYVCFENHDNVDNEIFRPSDKFSITWQKGGNGF